LVLLSLVVGVSIQSVGVLLLSAFIVTPACTARILSQRFTHYVGLAMGLGGISAVLGMIGSAAFNLPSGPSIVTTQLILFLLGVIITSTPLRRVFGS
jgi:zinc/manganese transport system permease protein